MKKLRVNVVSESEVSVQGHGVHTAYVEMVRGLEARSDVEVIPGEFGRMVPCDIVHLHTIGSRTWRKLIQNKVVSVVSTHVVPDSFVGSLVGARWWKGLAGAYLRWFYNRADHLVAVSSATADELRAFGVRTPITVIDNAIDTSRYQTTDKMARQRIRTELGISDDAFVVIGAGQVQPRKRVDRFIEAARQRPGMAFIWVGGMPFGALAADHHAMEKMMKHAPANMFFPGIVSLDDMPAYYQAADVFWLPSEQETFGLVVVEAAASGLPVLLRDISDYDATFRPYGVMVDDAHDIQALDRLASDTAYFNKERRHARELAQRFDSRAATEKLVALYRQILADRA